MGRPRQLCRRLEVPKANRIYCDGALSDKTNIRTFLAEQAPIMLAFSIANGKLAVIPALPFDSNYEITASQGLAISHYFTLGNIIEGSYAASYLEIPDRAPVRAVMMWRMGEKNSQPSKDSRLMRWDDQWPGNGADDPPLEFVSSTSRAPQQTYDLSQWVSNEEQALMVGRFLMSQRQRVTHRVSFKTTPYGLNIAPGQHIKLDVPTSPPHRRPSV